MSKAAQDRGVRFGRPSALTPEQVALGRRLIDEGRSAREVARVILKCRPETLYRELAKMAIFDTKDPIIIIPTIAQQ